MTRLIPNAKLLTWYLLMTSAISLFADLSLPQAMQLSSETGQNIYVDYTATWCLPCQIFEETVLFDEKVSDLLESDFIMIKADYDNPEYKTLFDSYAIACMPTQHILNENGDVLLELSGNLNSTSFFEAILPFALIVDNQTAMLSDNDISAVETETQFYNSVQKQTVRPIKNNVNKETTSHNGITQHKVVHPPQIHLTESSTSITKVNNDEFNRATSQVVIERPIVKSKANSQVTAETTTTESQVIVEVAKANSHFIPETSRSKIITKDISEPSEYYVLQVGAFSSFENAQKQKEKILAILKNNVEIELSNSSKLYTVSLGKFQKIDEFVSIRDILNKTGIDHFVKRKKV